MFIYCEDKKHARHNKYLVILKRKRFDYLIIRNKLAHLKNKSRLEKLGK